MKTKVALVIFILASIALGVALMIRDQQATDQHKTDVSTMMELSNHWSETSVKLQDQVQAGLALEKELATRKSDIVKLSNDLAQASENLAKSDAAVKAAIEETQKRDTRIAELEKQKDSLDKQADDLKGNITKLEGQISDTERKLAASEGDKAFLQRELQRLRAEKDALEHQFNDLAVMRAQVRKLREQMSVSQRLDWMREGVFAVSEQKGAQRLMQGAPTLVPRGSTNAYDLNVEVKSDGSIQVIAPLTNAPAKKTPPSAFDPLSPIKQ